MDAFKVIIAGGRDFTNYEMLVKFCDACLKNKENVQIVSGTASGADTMGEQYAKERNYEIISFPAAWDDVEGKPQNEISVSKDGRPYWKVAGHVRNGEMAKYADALIAFWGGTPGTYNMIKTMRRLGKPVRICRYGKLKEEHDSQLNLFNQ